jgi:hypothetical protein
LLCCQVHHSTIPKESCHWNFQFYKVWNLVRRKFW